jgi:hypothetical protein
MKSALLSLMLSAVIVIGSVSVTSAQITRPWTTVGSAGTVDEASLATYDTAAGQVRIDATAPLPASVVIRYNVVALESISDTGGIRLTARYRDNGAGAQVVARLRQVSFATDVTTTVLTVNSNDVAPGAGFQSRSASSCDVILDFASNAYFIEANLTKTTGAGDPVLHLLRLDIVDC